MAAVPPHSGSEWMCHIIIGSSAEYPKDWLTAPFDRARQRTGPELQWVVVTDGQAGATAYGPDSVIEIPLVPARRVDSTGAGDAFAAGILHGLVQSQDILTAAMLGSWWGAVALEDLRSVPPRWDELGLGGASGDWAQRLADGRLS
jgi:sulfofructose kinase